MQTFHIKIKITNVYITNILIFEYSKEECKCTPPGGYDMPKAAKEHENLHCLPGAITIQIKCELISI